MQEQSLIIILSIQKHIFIVIKRNVDFIFFLNQFLSVLLRSKSVSFASFFYSDFFPKSLGKIKNRDKINPGIVAKSTQIKKFA